MKENAAILIFTALLKWWRMSPLTTTGPIPQEGQRNDWGTDRYGRIQ